MVDAPGLSVRTWHPFMNDVTNPFKYEQTYGKTISILEVASFLDNHDIFKNDFGCARTLLINIHVVM